MSGVSKVVSENDIKWCAADDCFYIGSTPVREAAFIRYARLNWDLGLEQILVELRNNNRIVLEH